MPFRILSVGFDFPGGECEYVPHRPERSLLDGDIVVFQPGLSSDYISEDTYNGLPCLTDNSSFALKRDLDHWRSELSNALQAGKTIVVYLSRPETIYVATGQAQWSGTGRNARKTRMVTPIETYSAIPLELAGVVPATGETMRPAGDLGVLSPYWNLCAPHSRYEVYLSDDTEKPLLVTKTGNKVVGAAITGEKGNMFLLPNLVTDSTEFVKVEEDEEEDEDVERNWTRAAIKFGKQLSTCIAELHKALMAQGEVRPAPLWTMEPAYKLSEESALELEIEKIDRDIQALQTQRESLASKREVSGGLRRLLYEKGKPLESALLEALRLMAFKAESFKDTESEFDAVFISAEGRFLGEAEGKDNGPINIDKLSQLERNIQEDFAKEGVVEHANGVLFGNAFRLLPLKERNDFFTAKCLSGAKRSGIALVRTPDLFEVARYLRVSHDEEFAALCRQSIVRAKGQMVKFPEIPGENTAAAQAGEGS